MFVDGSACLAALERFKGAAGKVRVSQDLLSRLNKEGQAKVSADRQRLAYALKLQGTFKVAWHISFLHARL